MAARTEATGLDGLFRLLVAYRLLVYLAGTVAIGTPLFLAVGFDVEVPGSARTAIVVASLGLMILTYVGERRVGLPEETSATERPDDRETYSLRKRAAVGAAVVGVALGVYIALERNPVIGGLFVLGALLFARIAYGGEDEP